MMTPFGSDVDPEVYCRNAMGQGANRVEVVDELLPLPLPVTLLSIDSAFISVAILGLLLWLWL